MHFQQLRPLLTLAFLGLGAAYWFAGWPGVACAAFGFVLFWFMLGLGFGYWFGTDREADKALQDMMERRRAPTSDR